MYKLRKSSRAAFENFVLAHRERAAAVERVASRPFLLLVDPSSICQLQCPMCPTGIENATKSSASPAHFRRRNTMDPALFDALLDELGEDLFIVHLYNWGEPLLNRHLPRFIRTLHDHRIYTDTNTNLSLPLTDQAVDELVSSGIDRIEASIDGFSAESYVRYRRKGNFDLALRNILRLAEARTRLGLATEIVWNYLVFRFNEHEVDAARRFCDDHGLIFVRREASVMTDLAEEFLPTYREPDTSGGFAERRLEPFDPDEIRRRPDQTCGWHYFYSIVNADGSVSPCCAPWEGDWDFGTVAPGQNSFGAVWNNDRFLAARSDVAGKKLLASLEQDGRLSDLVTVDDFVRSGSLCEGCQMPPAMYDLYSNRAGAVIDHYNANHRGMTPELDRAFAALAARRR